MASLSPVGTSEPHSLKPECKYATESKMETERVFQGQFSTITGVILP